VLIGVVLIWIFEMRTKLPMESLTALVFASGVAIAFLFLPLDQAETALVGDISTTDAGDAAFSALASLAVMLAVNGLYPKLLLINVSEDLAASEGVDVNRCNLLYLLLIAVIVALGVKVVGSLLTAALVAIPPVAARTVSKSLRQYAVGSIAIGVASALVGILLYELTGEPAGPLIILVSAAIFLSTLPMTRRYPRRARTSASGGNGSLTTEA
jgi:ABC-type Mn2+/Zn2+ transport system permease subunit